MARIEDIVTVNVNNYDKFLDKSRDFDRILKRTNFENRLNVLFSVVNSNSFLEHYFGKIFNEEFNRKIKKLCDFKENEHEYGFDYIDKLVNDEIDLLEKNIKLLDLIASESDIKNIIINNNLFYKVDDLFSNCDVKGTSVKNKIILGLNSTDIGGIKSCLENKIIEIKELYRDKTIKFMHKYLENVVSVFSVNNEKNTTQISASFNNFSTEISLKNLYTLINLDEFVDKNYLNIIGVSNIDKVIESDIDSNWKNINKNIGIDELNAAKELLQSEKLPSKWNGHSLFVSLNNYPEHIKTFIKYKIMVCSSDGDSVIDLPTEDQFVTAKDVMLMFRDFNLALVRNEILQVNTDIIRRSNDFDGGRYSVSSLNNDDLKFNISFAIAAYETLYHELKKYKVFSCTNVPTKYNSIKDIYSDELYELTIQEHKEDLLDRLIAYPNNEMLLKLTKKEFYNIVKYFSYDEIIWAIEEINNNPKVINDSEKLKEFKNLIYYCTFFKTYEENNINFDSPKYARINKLFKTIKNTNDVTLLARQFEEWFNNFNINELTEEEIAILSNIDYKYIYNQLDYASQVIFQKCKKYNIKFYLGYKKAVLSYPNADIIFEIFKDSGAVIPDYIWWCDYKNLEQLIKNYNIDLKKLPKSYLPLLLKVSVDEIPKILPQVQNNINNLMYIPSAVYFEGINRANTLINCFNISYKDIPDFPIEALKCSEKRLRFLNKIYNKNLEQLKKLPGYVYTMNYDRLINILKRKGNKKLFSDSFRDRTLLLANEKSMYGGFDRKFETIEKGKTKIETVISSKNLNSYSQSTPSERIARLELIKERANGKKQTVYYVFDYMLLGDIKTFRLLLHLSENLDMFFSLKQTLFFLGRGKLEYLLRLFGDIRMLNRQPDSLFILSIDTIDKIISHPYINHDINKLINLPSTFFDLTSYKGVEVEVAFNNLWLLEKIESLQKNDKMIPLSGDEIFENVVLINNSFGKTDKIIFSDSMLYKSKSDILYLMPIFEQAYNELGCFFIGKENFIECLKLDINEINSVSKCKEQFIKLLKNKMNNIENQQEDKLKQK